jgi:molecular chaperone HscC
VSEKSVIVGIDLGTTFSLAATMIDGVPTVLPNAVGELLTPSAVSLADDGIVLVGAPARARATTHPTRTALAFKRDMGTEKVYDLGLKKMTPQELSALVLGALKRDAEAALGRAVDEAVVTVPAYFGDLQRQATRDAGAICGLKVERIINEPTAAAMAYGLHERTRELRAVVLDLGGGTFDVTVLEIIEGVIEIQASAGDARLGGEDFDAALAGRIAARVKEEQRLDLHADPRAWARLREACETAKKRLSDATTAGIALPDVPVGGGRTIHVQATLSREDAESQWAELVERMRVPILRALRDAQIAPQKVDDVLLVGGSTRMPCVARLAAQIFGKLPLRKLPPDEAVAMGAAVQAALKAGDKAIDDVVVTDVAPFTLGIETSTKLGGNRVAGIFSPILERGTVIPASRVKQFSTVSDFQTEICIQVFQGEHSLCRDNQKLGEYTVKGLKPQPAGEGSVDVRFTYDLNGILEVETTIHSTGKKATMVIEKTPGRLSQDQIEKARKEMARLKFHPRDALPNTTALARADALYVELQGDDRERLGHTIALFRAALEAQEEPKIAALREELLRLIAAFKR